MLPASMLPTSMLPQEVFAQQFPHEKNPLLLRCPYRICPLGAHVDHQYGPVTGFALDKGVTLCFAPAQQPEVVLYSTTFPGKASFALSSTIPRKQDWGDYARAAANALMVHGHQLTHGFCGVVAGSLPIGGLSSSAAVIIVCMLALCKANAIELEASRIIGIALWAENQYVGVNVGKLDQSCEVYCRKDHLFFLDTRDDSFELIPKNHQMPPFEIMIAFSGLERALVGSAYNARVDECKAAAYALKAFSGTSYEKFADTRLRDVSKEVFEAHQKKLPQAWRKRARHYYTEVERVRTGVEAWRAGDMTAFGKAIFESGRSSIENYEAGAPELIALHEIAVHADGVYGSRFSGAGFKGCYMALIDPSYKDKLVAKFTDGYLQQFPHLKEQFSIHFCHSADGVDCREDLGESGANGIEERCV